MALGYPGIVAISRVKDGRIAEIGSIQSNAGDKVIDATGLIVAPGFVDHHTHFDAQIFYDPYCTDAGWHGVTTVTIGNCGFGFAPVRREAQDRAMLMMTRGDVLSLPIMKHMPWDWETYPEFLDSVDRTPKGLNVMSRFPVSPMLVYVLGIDRARMGGQDASEAEVDEMKRLVSEGIDAGAHGWSAQRLGMSSLQGDYDGHPAPSDLMTDELVISLAEASDGRGMIQISQDAISEDRSDIADDQATGEALRFIEKLAVASDCMIIFNTIIAFRGRPEIHREQLKWLEHCNNELGLRIVGHGLGQAPFFFHLEDWNFFDRSPAWRNALLGTREEILAKIVDTDLRVDMYKELGMSPRESSGSQQAMEADLFSAMKVAGVGDRPEYQQHVGKMIGEVAAEQDKDGLGVFLDLAIDTDGDAVYNIPNLSTNIASEVAEVINSPYIVPGISDGGAHYKTRTCGGYGTEILTWLVRDEGQVTLEEAHWHLSYLSAYAAGLKDRGFLKPGAAADIIGYDLESLAKLPGQYEYEVAHDLPEGDWRHVQRSEGYRFTMVNGETTFENGDCTNATPGTLIRYGRD